MATDKFNVYVDGWNVDDYKFTAYIAKYKTRNFPLHEWHYEFEITDDYPEKTAHVLKTLIDSNDFVYCLSFVSSLVDSRFNRLYKLDPSTYYPPPEGSNKRQPIEDFVAWYLDFNIGMKHLEIDKNGFLYIAGNSGNEDETSEGNVVLKINNTGEIKKMLSTKSDIKDIVCDVNNSLYLLTSKPSLIKFKPDGNLVRVIQAPVNSNVLAVKK